MIYLDNAATTFPKPLCMIREMEECMMKYCGNPGRSGHNMSMKTGEKVYEARKETADFFGIKDSSHVIFTYNATDGLNMAIKGVLKEGDHVITTAMEHNSVLRPLKALESRGVNTTIVRCTRNGYVHPQMIEREIRENTKLIVCTHASNVTGSIQPASQIGRMARERNILFLLDGSQSAGSVPIDVEEMNIDMLALPGHKGLLGPLGTGVLYLRPGIEPVMLKEGGTGTNSRDLRQPAEFPEGFESGTVNAPGIIGLGESIRYVKKKGIDQIRIHEENLVSRLEDHICNINELPGCRDRIIMYGPRISECRCDGNKLENVYGKTGIICLNIKDTDCEEVSEKLNQYGIAVRAGFHCAGIAHKTIGTVETGAVRFSVGPFNTMRQMDYTGEVLYRIARNC